MKTLKGKTKQTTEESFSQDWEDKLKVLVSEWIKRLIKFGELNEPKRNGGFTVYYCPDLESFISNLLKQEFKKGYDYGRRSALAEQEFEEQYGTY